MAKQEASMMHKFLQPPSTGSMAGKEKEWHEFLLQTMDQISTPLVAKMLTMAGITKDTTEPFRLLDEGCGLGPTVAFLQKTIDKDVLRKSKIISSDFSEALVQSVQKRIQKNSWINAEAQVRDAQATGLPAQSFTHITANIAFHTIPDSQAALKEAIRLLEPGGTLAFTTWHEYGVGWLPDVRAAWAAFPFDAPFRFSAQATNWGRWDDVTWVQQVLVDHGLKDVRVDVLAHLTPVKNAEHFMDSFGSTVDYVWKMSWDEQMREKHGLEEVKGLVKKFLEEKYGDKGWLLTWVSIAAAGRVPS